MSTSTYSFGNDVAILYQQGNENTVQTRTAAWTHPGADQTITGMTVTFTTYNGGYRIKSISSGGTTLVNARSGFLNPMDTVSIPLPEAAWQGRSSGEIKAEFMRRSDVQAQYWNITLVVTYETIAQPSTAVVQETEAGQPQTVAITNSNDTVQHRVTWSYENGLVTSGATLYGAATRYPSWAVPAASLGTLYNAVTDRAYINGTVTVVTLTADGTSIGSVSCDARLRIPDSAGPTLTVSTQTSHDTVADTVNTGSQTEILVQNHTSLIITPTADAQYKDGGAALALLTYRTPAGGIASSDTDPVTVPLTAAGSYSVQVTARDSRGLTRTVEVPVEVTSCEAPRIIAIDAQRWSSGDATGHQDEEGGYAQVLAEAQITSLASGATWAYELKVSGSSTALNTGPLVLDGNGFGYIGGTMDPDSAYTVTVTVTDSLGQSSSANAEIPTGLYTVHFLQGGKGMALGKQAEHYGLEISGDWPIRIHGQRLEEYMLDRLYPAGCMVQTANMDWDPMAQWPWTEWGRLADTTVDGITMAQWVRGR